MNDLISRQDAINEVCTHCTELERRGITVLSVVNYKQVMVDLLEQIPSAQQWIPCSERLPEEIGAYMTTVDYDEFGVATGQRYFYNKEIGWDDDAVVAWMPLPEPWKGEDDERIH